MGVTASQMMDEELLHLCNALQHVEERLSALGSVIACDDHMVFVHPNVDREMKEVVAHMLKVEVFLPDYPRKRPRRLVLRDRELRWPHPSKNFCPGPGRVSSQLQAGTVN